LVDVVYLRVRSSIFACSSGGGRGADGADGLEIALGGGVFGAGMRPCAAGKRAAPAPDLVLGAARLAAPREPFDRRLQGFLLAAEHLALIMDEQGQQRGMASSVTDNTLAAPAGAPAARRKKFRFHRAAAAATDRCPAALTGRARAQVEQLSHGGSGGRRDGGGAAQELPPQRGGVVQPDCGVGAVVMRR